MLHQRIRPTTLLLKKDRCFFLPGLNPAGQERNLLELHAEKTFLCEERNEYDEKIEYEKDTSSVCSDESGLKNTLKNGWWFKSVDVAFGMLGSTQSNLIYQQV